MSESENKEVTFKTITQKVLTFTFPLTVTVSEMKQKIFDDQGDDFEVTRQKLIYNGKILDDTQTLGEINVDEKKYIVVMFSKKKTDQPVVAQTPASSNVETAKASTPAPTNESSSSTSNAPLATPAVSAENEEKISNIIAMGYNRDEAIRALRAAFGDVSRAVEYLINGIPEVDAAADEALLEQDSGDEGDPLTFLRDSPQFAQLCQLVRAQPDSLPQILNQISQSNPELFQIIRENQEAFVQLLNHEVEGGEQGEQGQEDVQQAAEAGHMTIAITQADRDAIDRMRSLGFPEQLVIEAYFACDKNEELAVNYILSRMEEASNDN